ncbi:MAG TPA: SDR family oxidoreductase [Gammaproteobacteria bacterium]|nr:SDR family oxidoreductase [Gammaproteobacteria bacterium]
MSELTGKTAVITGASSGIGAATARALANAGANVVLAARRDDRLRELEAQIVRAGGNAASVATDVTDDAAVQGLVATARERFGGIDILVCNAGIMPLSMVANVRLEEWQRAVDVNVNGVFRSVAHTLPHMLSSGGGHIVVLSSVAGRKVFPGGAVYCATKYAVRAFAEGLRAELSPAHGIRVTVIEPGAVATELPAGVADEDVQQSVRQLYEEQTVLEAEDIAAAIRYAVTQPAHVSVNEVLIRPTEQPL